MNLLTRQEQQKYAQLQEIIKKLDEEKKRGDSLLYAMIPKAVADRLRKGITALETCQVRKPLLKPTKPPSHAPCRPLAGRSGPGSSVLSI